MNIAELISCLDDENKLNETLELIEDIIIDTPDSLTSKLRQLIAFPEKIENTNRFASLLSDLYSEEYIEPLIQTIARANLEEAAWLSDYMYALGNCLDELDEAYIPEESFVHLLGDWLLNTNGGEISWKSAIILENLEHPQCITYYEQGALSKGLFHQSRIACLSGLVNEFGMSKLEVYQELLKDDDPEVHGAAQSAIKWLERNE
ncbi:hypothetical protein [Candidatus Albibeggiatoa sp. nov. NOAA]|uniref:hypothetical protein n=1 Tax=Candidatus Albibeggiatoa sp. nov. NOAA TaxID=3162724 RepID=UPI003302C873|nr:hypothetical protein [Thiotrichaceae bacterium]